MITVAHRLIEAELYPNDETIEHFMDIRPKNTLEPDQYQSLGFLRCRLNATTICHEVLESIRCLQELQLTIDYSTSSTPYDEAASSHLYLAELDLTNCLHILNLDSLPALRPPSQPVMMRRPSLRPLHLTLLNLKLLHELG